MPRKKSTKKSSAESPHASQQYFLENDAPWGGFINIRLDDAQKEDFTLWYNTYTEHVMNYWQDLLNMGCKVSFSFDAEHEAYVCTIMGSLVGSQATHRYASTSRAGTLDMVIALSVWKHFVLAEGDYGNYKPKDNTFMQFG